MTDIKHDPELPYAIVSGVGKVWARFATEGDAWDYIEREGGTLVDTTPKPKIPEDAEFVYWAQGNTDYYARKNENGMWWDDCEDLHTLSSLLETIGDAEVTVLVRKEAS